MLIKAAVVQNGIVTNIASISKEVLSTVGPDYIDITGISPEPEIGWSYSNGTFTPPPAPPPPPQTVFTKFEFRSRFTLQELVGIDNAGANPTLTPEQKEILNTIGKNFEVASEIDLTHAQTIQGVGYLASVGLLTQERATQILTP